MPVVLGGDHSVAMGTIAGLARHYREKKEKVGLIWFDAHADSNTAETSPTGNIHGMPLAVALGLGAPGLVNLGRRVPDGRRLARRGGRACATWTGRSARTCAPRASAPSRCATSTSAACAP